MKIRKIEDGIRLASHVASLSYMRYRVGAEACDKKGFVLGMSCNIPKTHPSRFRVAARLGTPWRVALCAECATIIKVRAPIHTLYVARLGKDGKLRLAKPCQICQEAIRLSGVKRCWYTDTSGIPTVLED